MSTPAEIAEKARQEAVPPEEIGKPTDPDITADPEVKKTVTENQQVFFLLTKTIADQVKRDLEERQDKSNTQKLAMFTVIIGVISAIGSFLGYTFIDRSVDAAFKERLDAQLAQVTLVSELALLSSRAEYYQIEGLQTEQESHDLIDRVATLNSTFIEDVNWSGDNIDFISDQFANRTRLLQAIEPLMERFALQDRDDLVIKLYNAAPAVMDRSESVLIDVVHSLGRTLLSLPEGADAWLSEDGTAREMYQTYRSFADRAESIEFPELYLLYELNLRHLAGASNDEMEALVDKISDLNPYDESLFIDQMTELLNEDWRFEQNAETRLISTRVRDFLSRWGSASPALMVVLDNEI